MKKLTVLFISLSAVWFCFSCIKEKKDTPPVIVPTGVTIAGEQSPIANVGETLSLTTGSVGGVSSFSAAVTSLGNGISNCSGSATITNTAILNLLSNFPDVTINGSTVTFDSLKIRATKEGVELCSGPTQGICFKYSSEVGDTYPINSGSQVRTVVSKTGVDDYYWGGMYVKVIKVEEVPNFAKSSAVTKITYIANHNFGLVGIMVTFDDGTSVTFPFQSSTTNS